MSGFVLFATDIKNVRSKEQTNTFLMQITKKKKNNNNNKKGHMKSFRNYVIHIEYSTEFFISSGWNLQFLLVKFNK